MAGRNARNGMTAVEVLAATLLAAMLMVAVLGVMRGLKSHERALDLRDPTKSWQRSIAAIVQRDLENARSLTVSPESIVLNGFGGSDWLPRTIRYDVNNQDGQHWLVRTETSSSTSSVRRELMCHDVTSVSIFLGEASDQRSDSAEIREQPVVTGLIIQFWGTDGTPIFAHVFRQT